MADDLNKDDEIVDVRLPKNEYEILRDMIKKQEALGWLGKYFRNVLFVFAGGIVTFFLLWDKVMSLFAGFKG